MAKYFKNVTSYENLKEQFKALAKANHPDAGGNAETMKEINVEFDALFTIWKNRKEVKEETPVSETAQGFKNNFYTSNGWQGSNYTCGMSTTEIAKAIKIYCKEKYPTFKFSVTSQYYSGGSSIFISLMEAPQDIFDYDCIGDLDCHGREYAYSCYVREFQEKGETHLQANQYHIKDAKYLNEFGKAVLTDVNAFILSYNYDDSDSMIDYFCTNFYYDLNIGKWNKGFKVVEKTARIKAAKNEVKAPKQEQASEQVQIDEEYTITESKHTKTNAPIWLVKFNRTLDRNEYIELNKRIKTLGGYYSKFTHSFIFSENPTEKLNLA